VAVTGAAVIDGDPGQLHQVVLNLCLNAVEAMGGGGLLSVSAGPRVIGEPGQAEDLLPAGSYVELVVADTGAGMAEEVRERVFEPFFTTKSQAGKPGTGLGLSMVYGIVHSHRGAIHVDSAPGAGTRFQVLLPQGTLAAAEPAMPAASRPRLGAVLVVEDEPLLREVAMDALEHLGYQVHGAEDGSVGVEAFRALHGSLLAVLLDLKMPVMGGREAFQAMRGIDPAVPVLVCTGFGENAEVQALLSMGALGMIAKPYRISDLAAGLAKVPT
jgi:CheY-like chemotaxis protein